MVDQLKTGPTYEDALRVIGRSLDSEPVYNVSILETDDGFTVRYQTMQYPTEVRVIHFTRSRLQDLAIFQTAARGVGRKRDRHTGMSSKFPTGRQEFLRALGCMLDEINASALSFDELPDHVQLSYVRPDPSNPVRSDKRSLAIQDNEIAAILESARLRRGPGPLTLRA